MSNAHRPKDDDRIDIAPDRYLIAIGQRIEPRIYKTLDAAQRAAKTLSYEAGHESGVYRLSDAGCVGYWRRRDGHVEAFDLVAPALAFRPDGSSWLDTPAEEARG